MILYDKSKSNRLKYKFNGVEKIEKNYSQAYQDMFVLTMLNGKRNGTYLEIGASEAIFINNTYLLEKEFGWRGVSVDIAKSSKKSFKKNRQNELILSDALKVNYEKVFAEKKFGKQIDYLSLDIEPNTQTLSCLKKLPLDKYRFSVITYETDYYDKSAGKDVVEQVRASSREILKSYGYELIVGNIANTSPNDIFEDWYVDPKVVDKEIIKLFEYNGDFNDASEKFMLIA